MKYQRLRGRSVMAVLPVAIATTLASPGAWAEGSSTQPQDLDRIEVTGSRIKRAAVEGAVPVTVIDRASIDASGDISVADLLRDSTFSSFGNFRPQSGSSAQGVADIDLRGLGSERTLVLVDGRRAPYAPSTGAGADLNTIPLAAVERIEILSDGASAVYGSDAIGGVVNVILRKDFDGAEVRYGKGMTAVKGGDTEEVALVIGSAGENGSLVMGASYSDREIVWTRDQIGGNVRGGSIYGNNYYLESPTDPGQEGAAGGALPGYACNDPGFWRNGNSCVYDFNRVAAEEAASQNKSLFARGTYDINESAQLYAAASYSVTSTFGRFAPTPGVLYVAEGSPNDPVKGDGLGAFIYHRYAAAGNRDTFTDNSVLDIQLGTTVQVNDRLSLDVGARRSRAEMDEIGRGYIVTTLAEKAAADGSYNLFDPFGNAPEVVKGFTATTSRDGLFDITEYYANASLDTFQMGGGTSAMAFGLERRQEDYADIYDSLSEAGVVAGSSGNSAAGSRTVQAAFVEWLLPVADGFDFTLAARYDNYSDYGSDLSPKASLRWQPTDNFTLRASVGTGFRAPDLNAIHSKPSFSAEMVRDYRTCLAVGYSSAECGGDANNDNIGDKAEAGNVDYQVDTYRSGNPELESEKSRQFSIGLAWDPTDWLSLTADYYNIRIEDRIRMIAFQELVSYDNKGIELPKGTYVKRRQNGSISEITSAFANEGELETAGLDLNLRTRFDLGAMGKLENWLQVSRILDYTITDAGVVKDELGWISLPDLRMGLRNTWSWDSWSVNWNVNHIGSQQNPGAEPDWDFRGGGVNTRLGSYTTHDLAVTYSTPWQASISLGATNVADRYPELLRVDGRPWNFALYDAYGRTVYLRYTQKF